MFNYTTMVRERYRVSDTMATVVMPSALKEGTNITFSTNNAVLTITAAGGGGGSQTYQYLEPYISRLNYSTTSINGWQPDAVISNGPLATGSAARTNTSGYNVAIERRKGRPTHGTGSSFWVTLKVRPVGSGLDNLHMGFSSQENWATQNPNFAAGDQQNFSQGTSGLGFNFWILSAANIRYSDYANTANFTPTVNFVFDNNVHYFTLCYDGTGTNPPKASIYQWSATGVAEGSFSKVQNSSQTFNSNVMIMPWLAWGTNASGGYLEYFATPAQLPNYSFANISGAFVTPANARYFYDTGDVDTM